jgi:glutamine synthetase
MSIIKKSVDEMTEERKKANTIADSRKLAIAYDEKVKPYFETIRYNVDKLELIVGDEYWPLPKFRELLFLK